MPKVRPRDAKVAPRRPKGRPKEATRAAKETPRSPKEPQRGAQRRFLEHFADKNDPQTVFFEIFKQKIDFAKTMVYLGKTIDFVGAESPETNSFH